MLVDEVGLWNMALNQIGARDNISITTESSREAEVCGLWHDTVRDAILSAAPWPCATSILRLPLLAEHDDDSTWEAGEPHPQFLFTYGLPIDYLRPQYLTTFERFMIARDTTSRLGLMTNTENALLVYTARTPNIALWAEDLKLAVVYGLASRIALPLTGKVALAKHLLEEANNLILNARVTAANTNELDYDYTPDWIAGRGITSTATTNYVYPNGPLLTGTLNAQ